MEYDDFMDEELFDEDNLFDDDKEAKENNSKAKANNTDGELLESLWEKSEETSKKKRVVQSRPRPKLTDRELTSKKGLPALKALFDNYKPSEKQGPYENMDDVLTKMEYWAHGLFPQFNFEDFLEKAEVVGRKRLVRASMYKLRLGMPLDEDEEIAEKDNGAEKNEDSDKGSPTTKDKTAEKLFDGNFEDDYQYPEKTAEELFDENFENGDDPFSNDPDVGNVSNIQSKKSQDDQSKDRGDEEDQNTSDSKMDDNARRSESPIASPAPRAKARLNAELWSDDED